MAPGIIGFLEKGRGRYLGDQGFLVRGGVQITSSRARTISDESSVLTRLKGFEIVEKKIRLAV